MPWVIEFSGEPDLLARNTGVLDAGSYFSFVSICECSVDVGVASLQGVLDRFLDFFGL